jgi:hypothetical protein
MPSVGRRLKETGYEIDFREQFIWLAPAAATFVDALVGDA